MTIEKIGFGQEKETSFFVSSMFPLEQLKRSAGVECFRGEAIIDEIDRITKEPEEPHYQWEDEENTDDDFKAQMRKRYFDSQEDDSIEGEVGEHV